MKDNKENNQNKGYLNFKKLFLSNNEVKSISKQNFKTSKVNKFFNLILQIFKYL